MIRLSSPRFPRFTGSVWRKALVVGVLAVLLPAVPAAAAPPTPAPAPVVAPARPASTPLPTLPKPGRPPFLPVLSALAVRQAYHQAFTGGEKPAFALAAGDDGPALAATLAQAISNFPAATQTATVTTRGLVFTDPRHAAVQFHIAYQQGADFGNQLGGAVFTGGRWKVSRDTFCTVMGWAGATCPPRAGPQPADPAAARAAVTAAYHQAFTGNEDPAFALAAVEDGSSLVAALNQAISNFPDVAATAQVTTSSIIFTDRQHASLTYDLTASTLSLQSTGTAVLTGGTWKVSRDTYCGFLSLAGATCPPAS